jgi:hypothetical protein
LTRTSVHWQLFDSLDKVHFSWNAATKYTWTIEEDREYINDPDTDVRVFDLANENSGGKGYAVIDVVDYDEFDMYEEGDEDEDEDKA